MAIAITDDNQIAINGFKYQLTSPLIETYLSPVPGKINFGSDSFSQENYLSNWIQKDRRGGILINEMDESIHTDRSWWTNLITSYDGHLTLPRKATEISTFNVLDVTPTWTSPTSGTGTGWSNLAYAYDGDTGTQATSNGVTGWTNYGIFVVPAGYYGQLRFWVGKNAGAISGFQVDGYNGLTWTALTASVPAEGSYVTINHTDQFISQARIRAQMTEGGALLLYEIGLETCDGPAVDGTPGLAANFNGELYWAIGNQLCKLDAGRASFTSVHVGPTTITALIPSLNSRLYIFYGDTIAYEWMSTAEGFTQSNSTAAYWGVEANGLLYKLASTGVFSSSADPDGATPTWNNLTDVTVDVSKIEGLLRGRDADGLFVVYLPSNTTLQVYDATNDKWLPTELRLPDHPNGGKGAVYWNDAHYFSYGLGVKKYTVGPTASAPDVGLDREGGIPVEYNGEIVKFCPDSQYFMAALVDASQTSGNSQSGLYVWTGIAWECWWVDPSNNGAMHDVIVSSAESGYAIYWDCGGTIFYINLPRGIQNVRQLSGTQAFEASGIFLSSWFDAGTVAYSKMVKAITSYAKSVTTTETITIQYRTNHTNEDRDTGWSSLVVLNSTGENGAVETLLTSGAGLSFDAIQFRIDMARGATTTLSPDLLALVTAYMLKTGATGNRAWNFTVKIDGEMDNQSTFEQYTSLWSAIKSATLIPIVYRSSDTTETHYVQLFLASSSTQSGDQYLGEMSLQAIEV